MERTPREFVARLWRRVRKITVSRWLEIFTFAFPLTIYILALNAAGGQSGNVVGVQSSMIQSHSLGVSEPGIDEVSFGGNLFSVYAPGLSFLSLPFALLGFVNYNSFLGYVGNAAITDEVFLAVCAAFSSLIAYKVCRFYAGESASVAAGLTLSIGTTVFPFAVSVFPHDAALLFSLAAVYVVMMYLKSAHPRNFLPALGGLLLGVATLTEYASGLFAICLLVYVFLNPRWKKNTTDRSFGRFALQFISLFSVVGVGLNLLYNYALFGDPLIFPQMLFSSGAHFALNLGLIEHFIYYLLSPFRGIFFLSPILILGVIGLREMYKSREWRLDSLLFSSLFVLVALFYSSWQGWDGAWSYGPRFLIIVLPYFVIPISVSMSRYAVRRVFLLLFLWSAFVQLAGAIAGPSAPGRNAPMLFQLFSYALPSILAGNTSSLFAQIFAPANALFSVSYFLVIFTMISLAGYCIVSIVGKETVKRMNSEILA